MATKRKLTEQGEIRFYEWMENRIAEAGSRRAFAEKIGVHENNLSSLRRGNKMPTLSMVEKMAAAYGLEAADIIGADGAEGKEPKPRGDRTGKKRVPKAEPQTEQTEEKLSWEMVLRDQIDTVYQDIMKLEEEVRQLKLKKQHYEEILAIYHDWRAKQC